MGQFGLAHDRPDPTGHVLAELADEEPVQPPAPWCGRAAVADDEQPVDAEEGHRRETGDDRDDEPDRVG